MMLFLIVLLYRGHVVQCSLTKLVFVNLGLFTCQIYRPRTEQLFMLYTESNISLISKDYWVEIDQIICMILTWFLFSFERCCTYLRYFWAISKMDWLVFRESVGFPIADWHKKWPALWSNSWSSNLGSSGSYSRLEKVWFGNIEKYVLKGGCWMGFR